MIGERRTTHERLLTAFRSSHLELDSEHRGDADYLIALGIAGSRSGMLGGDVLRLQLAGSPADYRNARESVVRLTRRLAMKHNWRLSGDNTRRVGELALAHHVFPTCPVCKGRRFEVVEGSPSLSGRACRACHGTGARPIQRKLGREIREVLETLERISEFTEGSVARLMR
ncbi:MAG TPA: hypothetical protein P5305_01535 [Rubrivivax sp.]|nr:hypothetical protein [Rubrivivax sp.]HRY86535.1 hypothetical protein [Rubrivivax sp.]